MPVTLTFVGDDWAEVSKQMHAALGAGVVFSQIRDDDKITFGAALERGAEPKDGSPTKPPRTAKPKAEAPKEDAPVAEADDKDDPKPEGLNYETDIKPLVLEIAARFGRDKVMEVLAKYGVTNAGHVPVDDQPALMEDIRLVLEG